MSDHGEKNVWSLRSSVTIHRAARRSLVARCILRIGQSTLGFLCEKPSHTRADDRCRMTIRLRRTEERGNGFLRKAGL